MKLVKISSFLLNSSRIPRKQNLPALRSLLKVKVGKPTKANRVAVQVSTRAEREDSLESVAFVAFRDITLPIVLKT